MDRTRGWIAAARLARLRGRRRAVLRACLAGLAALDEHRATLGATELQAAATSAGAELADLGLGRALDAGDAGQTLSWSERWRATTLVLPRPSPDPEQAGDLAALRLLTRRPGEVGRGDARDGAERLELERRISGRARQAPATSGPAVGHRSAAVTAAVRRAVSELDGALVSLVELDGRLHAVTVRATGRPVLTPVGGLDAALGELEHVRFALHQVARAGGRAGTAGRAWAGRLDGAAERLEQVLLGDALTATGTGPLVIVPSVRLHGVPWGLLPRLRDRRLSVAPSASSWLRSRAAAEPADPRVVLVQGPDLGSGGAEVTDLARAYPRGTRLSGAGATVDAVLEALDGAALAHVAAHGEFRSDNPMFSSLRMADGPLTVHDVARLTRAPHRIVLSSCESGLGQPTGADALLGLASALIPLGTVGILASVVPVNDEATVPVMLTVHERLRAGGTLADGLRDARLQAGDDPLARATAASFVALGSG